MDTTSPPPPSVAPLLAIVPGQVDRVARDWDEQHLDLRAAARQVAGASTSGFGATVAAAAADFTAAWEHHLAVIAADAEDRAVTLRVVTSSFVRTDAGSALDSGRLGDRLLDAA